MDCEKYEAAMMDELYGELDEVTSAAAKRHVASCGRCAARIGGLTATRRLATVPLVDPPPALENRILAVAGGAAPALSVRHRIAGAVSLAGSWAMRPQTAMAAVFLVMIGSSLLLLRGRAREVAQAPVTVTEQGSPAPPVSPAERSMPTTPALSVPPASPVVAAAGEARATTAAPSSRANQVDDPRPARTFAKAPLRGDGLSGYPAPAAQPPSPIPGSGPPAAKAAGGAGYASGALADRPAAAARSAFDTALGDYREGRFDDAAREFSALAPADSKAELWAARAVREAHGCSAAVARFDQLAQRAQGALPGWDALLEGALCYRALSRFAEARARLGALLGVDSHKDRAQAELDKLDQLEQGAQRSQNVGAAAAAPASKPASAEGPPRSAAAPPAPP